MKLLTVIVIILLFFPISSTAEDMDDLLDVLVLLTSEKAETRPSSFEIKDIQYEIKNDGSVVVFYQGTLDKFYRLEMNSSCNPFFSIERSDYNGFCRVKISYPEICIKSYNTDYGAKNESSSDYYTFIRDDRWGYYDCKTALKIKSLLKKINKKVKPNSGN